MTDVVIIGAGVIGCSVALALSRRGWKTLNIDALPAAGYGSTSYSSAVIRPYYSAVESTMLAYENHFLWRDFRRFLDAPEEADLADYVQCGCYLLKTAENGDLASATAVLDEAGAPYEHVDADMLRRLAPGIALTSYAPPRPSDDPQFGEENGRSIHGALYFPTAGYVSDPQRAAVNFKEAAESHGAKFRFNARVTEIRREGGRIAGVTLDSGERVDAAVVVNVAGPHSSAITRMAGIEEEMAVATRAMRTEIAHTPAPPGAAGLLVADTDTGVYLRGEGKSHVLIGSLEPACDPLDWRDPDDCDTGVTEQWTNQVWRAALRFPALPIPNQAQGYGALYDVTPDWAPIYDKSGLKGYFMAIGTSGNQFKNAPLAGEIMADLIDYESSGGDHDETPLKKHLVHSNRTLDLGFFSRRRKAQSGGGSSVLG